jgi:dTDP-4-amino-4,6-dideoxygalactose transaminase
LSAYRIPFNKPPQVGRELEYVEQAFAQGHLSGDGPFTRRCSELLEGELGAARVLLTTSCTHALEMSALLLDLQPGDEVIVPSFAFVTTALAFTLHGATPVFVDVCPETLNVDPARVAAAIGPRTRAIVALHYGGVACDLDALTKLASEAGITLIEDNAHGLFGAYRGKPLGTFGALATQSFHETKNFSCGEGGALIINDPQLAERAEILREKGTNRSRFFRGQIDKYSWVDTGSSYLPSEILTAVLCAQLEAREKVQARRHVIWERYASELKAWASTRAITLPVIPDGCDPTAHVFWMLLPSLEQRGLFIEHLKAVGVLSVFHYLPLHLSDMGRRFGGKPGDCPVSEDVSDRLVRLPLFFALTDDEQSDVIGQATSF